MKLCKKYIVPNIIWTPAINPFYQHGNDDNAKAGKDNVKAGKDNAMGGKDNAKGGKDA